MASTSPITATAAAASPSSTQDNSKLRFLLNAIKRGNIPEIVTNIIGYAIEMGASDIHIEPEEETIRIRYRVDGVLKEIAKYAPTFHPAMVSRVKIISNLKIDEQRIPQDGRAQFVAEDAGTGERFEADLRISTLPTVHGESIVMRIQNKSKKIPTLDQLGLQGNNLKYVQKITASPNGVLLVSGPTGSGKTTTLYSILSIINSEDVNILTLEDPVEYQMAGLNQSQVRPDIGYDFASGLRSALRQDPDIIMIGEIRDLETIEIAIRSALTGHFVLSTIHTNSAVESVTRLRNMGVKQYLITSAVRGVLAQRLVRKICEHCKETYIPSRKIFEDLEATIQQIHPTEYIDPTLLEDIKLYRGKGCSFCSDSGYKGRLGIFEVLLMTEAFNNLVLQEASSDSLLSTAMQLGMTSMKQDGIIKVLQGRTTIEEIYRVANDK